MKVELIGGPVDGEITELDNDCQARYFVIGIYANKIVPKQAKDCDLFCCYRLNLNNKTADFVSTRTAKQMVEIK